MTRRKHDDSSNDKARLKLLEIFTKNGKGARAAGAVKIISPPFSKPITLGAASKYLAMVAALHKAAAPDQSNINQRWRCLGIGKAKRGLLPKNSKNPLAKAVLLPENNKKPDDLEIKSQKPRF